MNILFGLLLNASSGAGNADFVDGPVGNPQHINFYFFISIGVAVMLLLLKKMQKGVPEEHQVKKWEDFEKIPDFQDVEKPHIVATDIYLILDITYGGISDSDITNTTTSTCLKWCRNYFIYTDFCERFSLNPDPRVKGKYRAILGLMKFAESHYAIDWHALERFFTEEISPYLERKSFTSLHRDVNESIYAD